MSHCAPGNKGGLTCFSINSLRKIASEYNHTLPNKSNKRINFDNTTSKDELWKMLRQTLSKQCNTEICWLDLDFVKNINDPNLEGGHRPKGPAKSTEWLTTSDINHTMKQYEKAYKGFVFFGPVPIDFAIIQTELNNMNLSTLHRQGVRSIGIIFNMDPHDQSGSHWVAMYIDLVKREINYFDIYGICQTPKEIKKLINSLYKSGQQLFGQPIPENIAILLFDSNKFPFA